MTEGRGTHVDSGLYASLITSLAQKDTEIGARLGISLFFIGLSHFLFVVCLGFVWEVVRHGCSHWCNGRLFFLKVDMYQVHRDLSRVTHSGGFAIETVPLVEAYSVRGGVPLHGCPVFCHQPAFIE